LKNYEDDEIIGSNLNDDKPVKQISFEENEKQNFLTHN